MDLNGVHEQSARIVGSVETAIVGKRTIIERALAILLAHGHLLIEDIPGVGKTTLAKALARTLGCDFKRIQCTPDLLPSDITGTTIYNQKTGDFQFRPGPVFANVVLADEINRSTPKTQSALLECMEERQVTVDGVTYPLPSPFFVIATQNNVELTGTYPLPEAQLDRFMARVTVGYPGREEELRILEDQVQTRPVDAIGPLMNGESVTGMQRQVRKVHVDGTLRAYVLDIVAATRSHPALILGASPRASLNLLHAVQALAALYGRPYVTPDDIKTMAPYVLAHRLIVRPEHRIKGTTADACVEQILQRIPVPVGATISQPA
ncbi:MAG TPA: MoxR family ATPase [Chthonomonadales bacterium]|nr:MoxR family ATPase [Chthonomonadales bacterium]